MVKRHSGAVYSYNEATDFTALFTQASFGCVTFVSVAKLRRLKLGWAYGPQTERLVDDCARCGYNFICPTARIVAALPVVFAVRTHRGAWVGGTPLCWTVPRCERISNEGEKLGDEGCGKRDWSRRWLWIDRGHECLRHVQLSLYLPSRWLPTKAVGNGRIAAGPSITHVSCVLVYSGVC